MKRTLLQNRIDPSVKEQFHRYSQLVGIPMNKLIEGFILDGIENGRLGLKTKLWSEFSSTNRIDI